MLAQAIHGLSQRTGAFVAVNYGAIRRDLVESGRFGHRKGTLSGALQDRGGSYGVPTAASFSGTRSAIYR